VERVGDDLADIGDRRKMDDHVALVHSPARGVAVGDVAQDRSHFRRRVIPRLGEIEDHRLVPLVAQLIDDVRPDEATPARDQNSHVATTSPSGSATG
jgi:hypothetical protein